MPGKPRLFVISGPSGAGKGTLLGRVREAYPELALTVSATTRPPRPGEVDGVAYHFMSDEEFDHHIQANDFLEWAQVHDHRYGTLKSEVDKRLGSNTSVALELDVQGAINVRKAYPDAVLIFIEPPSFEELERRLRGRGTEDDAEIAIRLNTARSEMRQAGLYDVRIVNDDVERASAELLETLHSYES